MIDNWERDSFPMAVESKLAEREKQDAIRDAMAGTPEPDVETGATAGEPPNANDDIALLEDGLRTACEERDEARRQRGVVCEQRDAALKRANDAETERDEYRSQLQVYIDERGAAYKEIGLLRQQRERAAEFVRDHLGDCNDGHSIILDSDETLALCERLGFKPM